MTGKHTCIRIRQHFENVGECGPSPTGAEAPALFPYMKTPMYYHHHHTVGVAVVGLTTSVCVRLASSSEELPSQKSRFMTATYVLRLCMA